MLSLTAFKAGTSAAVVTKYVENGAVGGTGKLEDYYTEKGQSGGRLIGSGWSRYELTSGDYKGEIMQRALDGDDVKTGEKLISGMGSRVPGFDLTFSADKSVSILFAAGDEKIKALVIAAQDAATNRTLKYIEDNLLLVNVGKGGAERDTAKLFASAHNHATSRAGDPDIHTHVVLANYAERADGKVMSLNARDIFHRQKELGAIYRAEMATQLKNAGLAIDKHGKDSELMRVVGVPKEIEKHFSKRRAEIEEASDEINKAIAKYGVSRAAAMEYVALDTRHDKEAVNGKDIEKEWISEISEMGFGKNQIDSLFKIEDKKIQFNVDDVLSSATNFNSVFSEKTLREHFINHAVGILSVNDIEKNFQKILSDDRVRRVTKNGEFFYTTQEMIDTEKSMINQAGELKNKSTHAISDELVEKHKAAFEKDKGFKLTTDQSEALLAATGQGNLVVIEGHAGTGKTTAIEIAANAWRDSGLSVRGAAPSGKAAQGLSSSGISSETIAALIMNNEDWTDENGKKHKAKNPLTKNDVVVIDEAGMVGSRDMQKLISATSKSGAKLVLMGDTKQLQAVAAGGAFGAIQDKYGIDASLESVQRQKNEHIKAIVAESRTGNIRQSLDLLNQKGNLHVSDDKAESYNTTLNAWKNNYKHESERASETSVILANTNIDCTQLNVLARAHLKSVGQIGGVGSDIEVCDRVGESLGKREFLVNDRIIFLKNAKIGETGFAIKNGQTARIKDIKDGRMTVQLDDTKQEIKFNTSDYKNINHAYAITTHKSQGITVDHAAVLAGGGMQTLNQTYVQLSRVRNSVDLVLPKSQVEKEMLSEKPTDKMRDMAISIAKKKNHDTDDIKSFSFFETREYLNLHAKFIDKKTNKAETENDRWKREVGDLVNKMSTIDRKETTIDYEIIEKTNELEIKRDIELSM